MKAKLENDDFDAIHAGLIDKIYEENRDDLDLVTPTRAAGILDIGINTLWSIPLTDLPRVEITAKVIKYKLSDLRAYIAKKRKTA